MEKKTEFELIESLIGSFIFVDLLINALAPFGIFGMYTSWNTLIIGSFMLALGIMFLLISKPEERQKAKAAALICFFFGAFFVLYVSITGRIIERFGSRGYETLKMSQFIAEFAFFFFVLHHLFVQIYPTSRLTGLMEKLFKGFIGAAVVLVVGIFLFAL